MNLLAEEIQKVSDDADKCINYAIGDKLKEFMRLQDEQKNSTNFVLSGVLIYAAAKIFGRKVDCLEQEILGVAKNFERVDCETGDKQNEPNAKKTRTKKYTIQDSVNIDQTLFEEKDIIIAVRDDITKTLPIPCRISRLQKLKDFFARNKEKSGKIAIPKSMILTNEAAVTNFGRTQIHDYDDYKDIVGSRRDFASFSFFINRCTGELQNDLNFTILSKQQQMHAARTKEMLMTENDGRNDENVEAARSLDDLMISNEMFVDIDEYFTPPQTPNVNISGKVTPISGKETPLNINLDEGIEFDIEQQSLLLPIHPVLKITDILRQSPTLFPVPLNFDYPVVMNFQRSILSVMDKIKNQSRDFELPETIKNDVRENLMKNIFMIPIKKLKHRCLFDLPDDEFRELKRRKLDQHKSTVVDQACKQKRVFKLIDFLKVNNTASSSCMEVNHDGPFLGFTKDEQNECAIPMTYNIRSKTKLDEFNLTSDITLNSCIISKSDENLIQNSNNLSDMIFKKENTEMTPQNNENSTSINDFTLQQDSGYTSELVSSAINDETRQISDSQSINITNESEAQQRKLSAADSCYQSLVSGLDSGVDDQSTINLPSFMDEINVNADSTRRELYSIDESEEQTMLDSEERVQLMKQSAINVAKWKDFLKPILAQSEKRSKIDMHEYGLRVINKIGNVNGTKTFKEISETDQMPAFFFTMLQLTNNRNIDLSFTNKTIREPTALENIKITLRSKTVHKEKFDQMGQHFEEVEVLKKAGTKRKAQGLNIQTSTPAKQSFIVSEFNTPNSSLSMIDSFNNSQMLSQASSGYFSKNSENF